MVPTTASRSFAPPVPPPDAGRVSAERAIWSRSRFHRLNGKGEERCLLTEQTRSPSSDPDDRALLASFRRREQMAGEPASSMTRMAAAAFQRDGAHPAARDKTAGDPTSRYMGSRFEGCRRRRSTPSEASTTLPRLSRAGRHSPARTFLCCGNAARPDHTGSQGAARRGRRAASGGLAAAVAGTTPRVAHGKAGTLDNNPHLHGVSPSRYAEPGSSARLRGGLGPPQRLGPFARLR